MSILFWKAYGNLILFDLYLARGNFAWPLQASSQLPRRRRGRPLTPSARISCGNQHGLDLVLERGSVPAAIGRDNLPAADDMAWRPRW